MGPTQMFLNTDSTQQASMEEQEQGWNSFIVPHEVQQFFTSPGNWCAMSESFGKLQDEAYSTETIELLTPQFRNC